MLYYCELITLNFSLGVLFFKTPLESEYFTSTVDQLSDSDYMGELIYGRSANVLFAYLLSCLANLLGQFPYFFSPDQWLKERCVLHVYRAFRFFSGQVKT